MIKLSRSWDQLKPRYDVIVIGSGYGGGIAASRLSRAGLRVCVLERGRERFAGDFPTTDEGMLSEWQLQLGDSAFTEVQVGAKTGLYRVHVGNRMNALVGCGLGGTSLINANVALMPDLRVFDDERWPRELRRQPDGALPAELREGYKRARAMLEPNIFPDRLPKPHKLVAMETAAAALGEPCHKVPITVAFEDRTNGAGVPERACVGCGDCVSGCNFESKRTVNRNYLPDACRHGAEIFTELDVSHVEKRGGSWAVYFAPTEGGRGRFEGAPPCVALADIVVLAAGSLGTPEILLRSKARGLSMSAAVGRHFTSNANVLGFGFNTTTHVDALGLGEASREAVEATRAARPGPCIVGCIDMRSRSDVADGVIIEEGVVPGPLAEGFAKAIMVEAAVLGHAPQRSARELLSALGRDVATAMLGAHEGAARNTLTMLHMGHDRSPGVIRYDAARDTVTLEWPEGDTEKAALANQSLERVAHALGGTYVPNPLWAKTLDHARITVQPLGGCVMADDPARGAVNAKGQLFAGDSGDAAHEGLYVMDGSVLPTSTGLNPFMTIAALSERACTILAADRGLAISNDAGGGELHSSSERPGIGLVFSERLAGHLGVGEAESFQRGEESGRQRGSAFDMVLSIATDDLAAALSSAPARLAMIGTLVAPALSREPLAVTGGLVELFASASNTPLTKTIRYTFRADSLEGETFWIEGVKYLRDDPGFDAWSDATTLFVSVWRGDSPAGPLAGRGIARVHGDDFAKQLRTMHVTRARSIAEKAAAIERFCAFFGVSMLEVYASFLGSLRS